MKLLFDQNLSHRLPARLSDLFPDSAHVRALHLDQVPDEKIWDYAKANGYCIVTQDSDFVERSRLFGPPPKVVWVHCGNSTPQKVEAIIRHNAVLIYELMQSANLHFVELLAPGGPVI